MDGFRCGEAARYQSGSAPGHVENETGGLKQFAGIGAGRNGMTRRKSFVNGFVMRSLTASSKKDSVKRWPSA